MFILNSTIMNKKKYLFILFLGFFTQAQSPLPSIELKTLSGQFINTNQIARESINYYFVVGDMVRTV